MALVCAFVAGCAVAPGGEADHATLITDPADGPPDAKPGSCYGKDVTAATIEVVTEDVLVEPAKLAVDGAVIKPAVYETTQVQKVITPREEFFFEVPCPEAMTGEFIASLQRALKARGLYAGPISGRMNDRTRAAIRAFQKPLGLNTGILSLDSALKLGLVAYGRPQE